MSVIKKFAKYSLKEIAMAEDYIVLASKVDDPSVAMKLQEIAKDEIRHCDYMEGALKLSAQKYKEQHPEDTDRDVDDIINDAFYDNYHEWKEKVTYKINKFVPKKQ